MSYRWVFEWHERFLEGHINVHDDALSGQPTTSINNETVECVWNHVHADGRLSGRPTTSINNETVECVRNLVHADGRLSIQKTASDVAISVGSRCGVLHNELHSVYQNMIPKMLSPCDKTTQRCQRRMKSLKVSNSWTDLGKKCLVPDFDENVGEIILLSIIPKQSTNSGNFLNISYIKNLIK
jgi:hypothetical protein